MPSWIRIAFLIRIRIQLQPTKIRCGSLWIWILIQNTDHNAVKGDNVLNIFIILIFSDNYVLISAVIIFVVCLRKLLLLKCLWKIAKYIFKIDILVVVMWLLRTCQIRYLDFFRSIKNKQYGIIIKRLLKGKLSILMI